MQYIDWYDDTWGFLDNFSYNFGLLYDSVVTMVQEILSAVPGTTNYFMIGYSLGNMFHLIFY